MVRMKITGIHFTALTNHQQEPSCFPILFTVLQTNMCTQYRRSRARYFSHGQTDAPLQTRCTEREHAVVGSHGARNHRTINRRALSCYRFPSVTGITSIDAYAKADETRIARLEPDRSFISNFAVRASRIKGPNACWHRSRFS